MIRGDFLIRSLPLAVLTHPVYAWAAEKSFELEHYLLFKVSRHYVLPRTFASALLVGDRNLVYSCEVITFEEP